MSEEHIQTKVTQKALIIVEDKVLMVLEDGDWELPGGRINKGEKDLFEALKREIKEELSVEIDPQEIFTAYIFTKPTGEESLAIVYKCNLLSSIESIKPQDGEIDEWQLLSKEELRESKNIYPNSSEAINKYLSF